MPVLFVGYSVAGAVRRLRVPVISFRQASVVGPPFCPRRHDSRCLERIFLSMETTFSEVWAEIGGGMRSKLGMKEGTVRKHVRRFDAPLCFIGYGKRRPSFLAQMRSSFYLLMLAERSAMNDERRFRASYLVM